MISSKPMSRDPASAEAMEILERRYREDHKARCRQLAQSEKDHLRGCGKPRCTRCREAKVLIPYYRRRARKPPALRLRSAELR